MSELLGEINEILRKAGISYPTGLQGVRDLVTQRDGQMDRALEAEAEMKKWKHGPQLKCMCDGTADCPDIDCPVHGDVRWFSHWLVEAQKENRALQTRITELRGTRKFT